MIKSKFKKAMAFSFIMAISSSALFAAGALEAIGTTLAGTAAGFLVGGPAGAIIGFLTAGTAATATQISKNLKKEQEQKEAYEQAYNQAYSQYSQAESMYYGNESAIEQTGLAISQTEANISSYDQALMRWQTQYDLEKQSLNQQAESQYSALMSNWQGTELMAAARGQSGGSADLISMQSQRQVSQFAGSDLRLDSKGGTYGTSLSEFKLDMLAGRNEIAANRQNQIQALSTYYGNLEQYQSLRNKYFDAYEDAYSNTVDAYNKTDKKQKMLATKPKRSSL